MKTGTQSGVARTSRPPAKLFLMVLAVFSLLLAACGATDDAEDEAPVAEEEAPVAEEEAPEEEAEASEGEAEEIDYPTQSIDFIIPYAPGGSTDPVGRLFSERLGEVLGTSIVVDNVPGAAGTLGVQQTLTSAPDGYTLGLSTGPALVVAPAQNPDLLYTDANDWVTPARIGTIEYYLVVSADAPWETIEEFLEDASGRQDDQVTVANSGAGNVSDFLIQQMEAHTDGGIRNVPFSGGGEAYAAVLGGQADAVVSAPTTVVGGLEAGEIRALAIFSDQSSDFAPDVPPITDAGLDATLGNSFWIIGPAGIPDGIYERLLEAVEEAITDNEELQEFLVNTGITYDPLFGDEADAGLQTEADVYAEILDE